MKQRNLGLGAVDGKKSLLFGCLPSTGLEESKVVIGGWLCI